MAKPLTEPRKEPRRRAKPVAPRSGPVPPHPLLAALENPPEPSEELIRDLAEAMGVRSND